MAHLQDQQELRQTSVGHAQHPLQLFASHSCSALLSVGAHGAPQLVGAQPAGASLGSGLLDSALLSAAAAVAWSQAAGVQVRHGWRMGGQQRWQGLSGTMYRS